MIVKWQKTKLQDILKKNKHDSMNVQYLTNEKGERTAVLVPIEYWKELQAKTNTDESTTVFEDMKEAIEEMNLIQAGKLKGISAKELLDEL